MMGSKGRSFAPLCNLSLEALVPTGHFYRHLDAKLDLAFARELVRSTYRQGGRPSIDPVVFFKLQLVMFFEGIRSERELVRVAADRLSLRWYLGYDLHEALPDHSSLTRIRQRYGLAVFRRFFEAIVEQCRGAGLVWGKELYFDATQVNANASLDSIAPRFAVEAHLGELFADSDGRSDPPQGRPTCLGSFPPRPRSRPEPSSPRATLCAMTGSPVMGAPIAQSDTAATAAAPTSRPAAPIRTPR
jgi:transposase